ncbi:hypothetical protein IP79_10550 [Porphyrobacter sp. AAP60]|nr:hypothetical protein IP79_10550 [Porphyrobacter sp. AAP60]
MARPDSGANLAMAAAGFIGCPFRLQGRDPAHGLDCVGLVAVSLAAAGISPKSPSGYGLRNLFVGQWLHFAAASGLAPSPGPIRTGDVVLMALGHGQHHLVIAESGSSVIHAHAGLGKVVRQPLDPQWRVVAKWHAAPQKGD